MLYYNNINSISVYLHCHIDDSGIVLAGKMVFVFKPHCAIKKTIKP
jgi:hypothetical protein